MTLETTPGRPPTDLWNRALTDPTLRDLPFKIETNEHGQLVLSPHKPRHSLQQSRIATLLRELAPGSNLPAGEAATELAIETSRGIKVPDVVWISTERLAQIPDDAAASPVMPEIAIEVLSKGNTPAEMEEKRRLYLDAGAHEVWMCDPEGRITFYDAGGKIPGSRVVPSFPASIA